MHRKIWKDLRCLIITLRNKETHGVWGKEGNGVFLSVVRVRQRSLSVYRLRIAFLL